MEREQFFQEIILQLVGHLDEPDAARRISMRVMELMGSGAWPRSGNPLRGPLLYYPGLRDLRIYPAQDFPWYEQVNAAVASMASEYEALLAERSGFIEVYAKDKVKKGYGRAEEGSWAACWLWLYGKTIDANVARCPRTMAALAHCGVRTGWGGFSAMAPGTHVSAHCGLANVKLRVHVPLVVPEGSRIRIGSEIETWREGEILVFDDSYEHEVWTGAEYPRCVLMFDILHPDLTEEEGAALIQLDRLLGQAYESKIFDDAPDQSIPWLYGEPNAFRFGS